jgi:hypothetical protein
VPLGVEYQNPVVSKH